MKGSDKGFWPAFILLTMVGIVFMINVVMLVWSNI